MSEEQAIPNDAPEDGNQKSEVGDQKSPPLAGDQPPETQDQTSNLKSQTANMEVHKHPHDVMHKKNWVEYFLEFLMLFLAVFLGFLAENQREHIVDRRREKELMTEFVNDLKLDT